MSSDLQTCVASGEPKVAAVRKIMHKVPVRVVGKEWCQGLNCALTGVTVMGVGGGVGGGGGRQVEVGIARCV